MTTFERLTLSTEPAGQCIHWSKMLENRSATSFVKEIPFDLPA